MRQPTAISRLLILVSSLLFAGAGQALEQMDDSALSAISGREGIALDLELTINADSNGNPLSNLSYCSGVGNPCVLGLLFANRNAGGGEWLVIKDFFGVLRFNDLQLDASRLPATSSAYANPERFEDLSGTCMIAGCDPSGGLAALFSFPETPGFNADVEWRWDIGRGAVQFGANGFLPSADNNASFVGVRVADTVNNIGQIDLNGSLQLYGI